MSEISDRGGGGVMPFLNVAQKFSPFFIMTPPLIIKLQRHAGVELGLTQADTVCLNLVLKYFV